MQTILTVSAPYVSRLIIRLGASLTYGRFQYVGSHSEVKKWKNQLNQDYPPEQILTSVTHSYAVVHLPALAVLSVLSTTVGYFHEEKKYWRPAFQKPHVRWRSRKSSMLTTTLLSIHS